VSGARRRTIEPVLLIGIGDAHGNFAPLFEAARREPAARALLQVGDLTAGKPGREPHSDDDPALLARLPLPLVWVHGNHERWEYLGFSEAGSATEAAGMSLACTGAAMGGTTETAAVRWPTPGVHLWPGQEYVVPGTRITVVGLPGNFAPTWYERPKPFPGDRVRHFNATDVAALGRFRHPSVLLMHEAFRGQAPGRLGAMGVPVLAELVRRLQPEVCLTGHHHMGMVAEHGPTLAIALPRAEAGYVRLWFAPEGRRLGWEFVSFRTEEQKVATLSSSRGTRQAER
jgi:hypothetical protein